MRVSVLGFIFAVFCPSLLFPEPVAFAGKMASPSPWSIHRANSIRIKIEPVGAINQVRYADFFVVYDDPNRVSQIVERVARDSLAPFDALWDCSRVADQGCWDLLFYGVLGDAQGRAIATDTVFAVLDRNEGRFPGILKSGRLRKPPMPDGFSDPEWLRVEPLLFRNDDNTYKIRSGWDGQALYFLIEVGDRSVFSRFAPDSLPAWDSLDRPLDSALRLQVFQDDCIGIFLDPAADRSELILPDDRFIMAGSSGALFAYRSDLRKARFHNISPRVRAFARRNMAYSASADSNGYTLEMALDWTGIGITPRENMEMGVDLYFVDRESGESPRVIASWSGHAGNHQNPSEWGTLVLTGRGGATARFWAVSLALVLAGAAGFTWLRFRRKRAPEKQAGTGDSPMVRRANEFMEANYRNPELSIKEVAEYVGLNPAYFGRLYKNDTGKGLLNCLNEIRVKNAQALLVETNKNVTEIAYEVGYNNLFYFNQVFRKLTGKSPSDFRKMSD